MSIILIGKYQVCVGVRANVGRHADLQDAVDDIAYRYNDQLITRENGKYNTHLCTFSGNA